MNSIVAIVVIAATVVEALPQREFQTGALTLPQRERRVFSAATDPLLQRAVSDTCDSICGVGVSGCLWEVDGERHCYKDWNNEVCKRSNTYNNAGVAP